MNLFDTHLHLSAKEFLRDLDSVVLRARESGVKYMITIGSGYGAENYKDAIDLSQKYNLLFALGVHPHDADLGLGISEPDSEYRSKLNSILNNIASLSQNDLMVGIGEIGLDYYYDHSERKMQKETFGSFLELAINLNMPVIIHSRDAFLDTIDIIKSFNRNIRGEFHCFTGNIDQARTILDMGFYVSIPGIVTFNRAEEIRKVAEFLPLEKILIETDAPFLAPEPFRGKRNEPSFIIKTYEKVAQLKGITVEKLAEQVIKNSGECFRIRKGYFDDTIKG